MEQRFTSCLLGVSVPLESLGNYSAWKPVRKKMTYSDSCHRGPAVTVGDGEMFSFKVTRPPRLESVQLLSAVLKLSCALSRCVKMNATSTTTTTTGDASSADADVQPPTGWFLICGMMV